MENDLNRRLDAALQARWVARQALLRRLLRRTAMTLPGGPGTHPHRDRGFTPEQFVIIGILREYGHGVTVKEITGAIDVPHSNVTRTLDRLEKKGLIHRKRGETDKRRIIVRLTLEGNKAARTLKEVERHLEEKLWEDYSEDDKRELLGLLSRGHTD
jgi:DNA-binding MarR family transcriptional regulator